MVSNCIKEREKKGRDVGRKEEWRERSKHSLSGVGSLKSYVEKFFPVRGDIGVILTTGF